ncbi:NAD-P-binding protein [Armillaria luteobubalina]|uniref:NAD-P-binding protein n=1 Tax=Armillaria luteobubalina TaxID=153913 RepID=A0AA39QNF7_9AGAR|nr:NAD-P-binding protein [Armillaria luteobubalina]
MFLDSCFRCCHLTAPSRLLAKESFAVALIARNADSVKALSDEINAAGGMAASFPILSYSNTDIHSTYARIRAHHQGLPIRARYHPGGRPRRRADEPRRRIRVDEKGKRGSLTFTGATASVRGNVTTRAFSAGKHVLRALSQSLAKEFGKQNVHVLHAIIGGGILTDSAREHSYLHLIKQPRSAWTWELDLRPAHEKW